MAIIASAQITADAARRGGASPERLALIVSRGMIGLFYRLNGHLFHPHRHRTRARNPRAR
ncbi:MAG TPA: hypothetical protein VND20_02690 [Candidatus Binataceae bacterium]|nr:hypothetical protein [Candidatus Binataceae bacterium]